MGTSLGFEVPYWDRAGIAWGSRFLCSEAGQAATLVQGRGCPCATCALVLLGKGLWVFEVEGLLPEIDVMS
jgi:hypothetical protein